MKSETESKMKKAFEELVTASGISVREYFMILRLAILHTDGVLLETSINVAEYELKGKTSDEVYKRAIYITQALKK